MGFRMIIYVDDMGEPHLVDERRHGVLMNQAQVDTYNALMATVNSAKHTLQMVREASDPRLRAIKKERTA